MQQPLKREDEDRTNQVLCSAPELPNSAKETCDFTIPPSCKLENKGTDYEDFSEFFTWGKKNEAAHYHYMLP